ncbi:hypothetical protein NDU88_000370 [Pleurodeles waltl]|uniref:Uncharacterized protein n=1 Tax=Pleurodeles waltl TaxID=8319 RepID=A0AAV7VTA2_PLEWA|nr:hypothetical protein NDU88_000370 [Pleurodeles waltl]
MRSSALGPPKFYNDPDTSENLISKSQIRAPLNPHMGMRGPRAQGEAGTCNERSRGAITEDDIERRNPAQQIGYRVGSLTVIVRGRCRPRGSTGSAHGCRWPAGSGAGRKESKAAAGEGGGGGPRWSRCGRRRQRRSPPRSPEESAEHPRDREMALDALTRADADCGGAAGRTKKALRACEATSIGWPLLAWGCSRCRIRGERGGGDRRGAVTGPRHLRRRWVHASRSTLD